MTYPAYERKDPAQLRAMIMATIHAHFDGSDETLCGLTSIDRPSERVEAFESAYGAPAGPDHHRCRLCAMVLGIEEIPAGFSGDMVARVELNRERAREYAVHGYWAGSEARAFGRIDP